MEERERAVSDQRVRTQLRRRVGQEYSRRMNVVCLCW
jgi:hypothetical protein